MDRRRSAASPAATSWDGQEEKCRFASRYFVTKEGGGENYYEESRVHSYRKQHCIVTMLHHNNHHTDVKMQFESEGIAIRHHGRRWNTGPLRGRLLYATGGFRCLLKQGNIYIRAEANLKTKFPLNTTDQQEFLKPLRLESAVTQGNQLQRIPFDINRNAAIVTW